MQDQDQDIIREFLVESHENLSRLDLEIVDLEKNSKNLKVLESIFRTFHTIKGTCGFLGFQTLETITHEAENILSQLRDGKRPVTQTLVTLILDTVDAIRTVLASIEAGGSEGPARYEELQARLRAAAESRTPEAPVRPPATPDTTSRLAAEPDEDGAKSSATADANIRVAVGLLDRLMDLVGELVLTRNQILQSNSELEDAALNATTQRLNLITTELQEGVMKTRMQPIGVVWNKLPRIVRDLSVTLGKQIRLETDGSETELDRTIIEAIKDPLVHLVRNACDHGIETHDERLRAGKPPEGRLVLRAYHEGGQVNIEIADDGAGIDVAKVKRKAIERGLIHSDQAAKLADREALNLIFQPGFSMARAVTNISGRGVGMDVVKSKIEKIGGVVDIFSRAGEGTTVKLKIPLTLAIIPGLVVTSGGERFVIPQVSLLELIRLDSDSTEKRIEYVHGTPVYRRRGSLLPVAYLNQVLGLQAAQTEAVSMVVLQAEDQQFGLVLDGINDTQEIVVKPLSKQLKGLTLYAGATIMGDGHVALILDVLGIGEQSGVLTQCREQSRPVTEFKAQAGAENQRLLLFKAGSFERLCVPLSLVARLEEFSRSAIERAAGQHVVQYRNQILPLIPLRSVIQAGSPAADLPEDPVQVIVFNNADSCVGLIVDQILDVVEDSVAIRQRAECAWLLGSAVVGGRVTDFLDLQYVIHAAGIDWFGKRAESKIPKQVLIAEPNAFSRALMRNTLDMAGYHVLEAGNLQDAVRTLEREKVDVVAMSLDLSPAGASNLLDTMRTRPEWQTVPVIGLADSEDQLEFHAHPSEAGDCQEWRVKSDRAGMIESLARLGSRLQSKGPVVSPADEVVRA